MTTPRRAYALDVLLAEVNKHAPHRSKASDGWIGDPAHAARVSDHNPNAAGVVRAVDITDDPAGGLDGDKLALLIAAKLGKLPALGAGAYVIHNRRIISTNRLKEGWRSYSGTNPHEKHVHVSVATASSGYDSRRPWNLYAPASLSVAFQNRLNEEKLIDLNILDRIIKHGRPRYLAAAAKSIRWALVTTARKLPR